MIPDADVFADALALPAPERAAFLAVACGSDPAQRARVEALLRAHGQEGAILAVPLGRRPHRAEPEAGAFVGRYRLLEIIGQGGCGIVWMAQQEQPVRRRVALKVIKLGMDTKEVIARFESERQALALMEHPNIAKIFEAGATSTGRPFFAMELVRGQPITRYCDERSLTTEQRLQLFIKVCQAIQHAHEKGVVHRDIKPSNILVTQEDGEPLPKVIDFGIAKAMQGRLTDHTLFTAFEQFIGTPAYMSPEQADFDTNEVDARSDVYSLGALLYELLAGCPPFDPKTLVASGINEIRRIIREVDPPRPSTRLDTLGLAERTTLALRRGLAPAQFSMLMRGDLDWVVMKALEKTRARRYDRAGDLAADLQRHLGHQPVWARPPSVVYRSGKFIQRHRFGLAGAALVGLALILGAAVSLRQSRRADRAERNAAEARAPAPRLEPKSIVVLPFENRSEDQNATAFFVDGLHEDVINSLARILDLRCVPLTSALTYRDSKKSLREIAGELRVAFVLTTSVRRDGQKVSLTGVLTNADSAERVWSRTYEQDLTDVFALQAGLAQSIAAQLKAVVSTETRQGLQRRPTENPAAYDLFLQARELRNVLLVGARTQSRPVVVGSFFQAQERLLTSAVTLDPKFAGAWAELARANSFNFHGVEGETLQDRSDARRASARWAVEQAVQLAPGAADVMLSHGYYLQYCEHDYARAAVEFAKVVLLQPNSPEPFLATGQLQRTEGKWTDALASFRRAVALDPVSAEAATELGVLLSAGRRYDELGAERRRRLALRADSIPNFSLVRVPFYATGSTLAMEAFVKDPDEKVRKVGNRVFGRQHEKFADGYLELVKNEPRPGPSNLEGWHWPLHTAVILAGKGRLTEARSLLEHGPANLHARLALDPANPMLLGDLACIEAVLGHAEEALRAVRQAVQLTPMELDYWQGPHVLENLAFVYAWTGDKTRAIETYARLLQSPCVSPRMAGMNVHVMRHALWFAPLRGDPRREALLDDPKNNAPLF